MHLLTPKGIIQKLSLTIHFLERKQAEFERIKKEQMEMGQQKMQLDWVKDFKSVDYQSKTTNPVTANGVSAWRNGIE